MRDIVSTLLRWHEENREFAVARVLSTWGSAPRRVGSGMLISSDMDVVGSVSGGCIENSVIESAIEVMETGRSCLLEYGVDDERAWSVGLSCGGRVRVCVDRWEGFDGSGFIETVWSDVPFVLVSTVAEDVPAHAVVYKDGSTIGSGIGFSDAFVREALVALNARKSTETELGGKKMFLHAFPLPRRLVIIGGADIAVRLLALAKALDFVTILVDPRAVFTSVERFEVEPDRTVTAWPQDVLPEMVLDGDTYAVLLTHDPKIDDPALHVLLRHPVAYIGALGGRRTQEKRNERLLAAGFSREDVRRIHGPVGLDIGAASPAEIALSILAQIVSVKNGGGGV